MHSIYIHVPFCLSRCGYCSFYSGEDHGGIPGYPALVGTEARLRADTIPAERAPTLYIGGGTPSLLGHRGLGELINAVTAHLPLAPEAEVTVEANPAGGLQYNKVKDLGVTRLSLGVQSLQNHHLQKLGRPHDSAQALAAVADALGARVDALLEESVNLHESAFEALQGPWEGTMTGSLHVTLEHGGRDSKVPVPAVPG